LVVILVREARILISLLKGHDPWYGSPIFLLLVIILIQEAILVVITMGGHLGYYPSMGAQVPFLAKYYRGSRGPEKTWDVSRLTTQEKEDVYPSDFRGSHLTQRESNYLRRKKRQNLLPFSSSKADNY
jgi:hypothetical protein